MLSNSLQDRAQDRAWVEVDTGALRANYARIQSGVGSRVAMIPMVKADGYGLGAERVVRVLEPLEPFAFGVAAAEEGRLLRLAGVQRPIIVFTPLTTAALDVAAAHALTPALSDLASLKYWQQTSGGQPFHVEVDTGMGRAGFDWRETAAWSEQIRAATETGMRWAGVFTHFQSADAAGEAASATQWQRFQDALAQLPVSREDLLVHACNSAAAIRWPEYAVDAVRPGIFLYGGHPAPAAAGAEQFRPEPVAAVRAGR